MAGEQNRLSSGLIPYIVAYFKFKMGILHDCHDFHIPPTPHSAPVTARLTFLKAHGIPEPHLPLTSLFRRASIRKHLF